MKNRGLAVEIEHNRDRSGQVIRHTGDYAKFHAICGWEPLVSWESGLKSTIDWYCENTKDWKKNIWLRKVPITGQDGSIEFH